MSISMNTHARPIFAPGMSPHAARLRKVCGWICRKFAASLMVSVFMFTVLFKYRLHFKFMQLMAPTQIPPAMYRAKTDQ